MPLKVCEIYDFANMFWNDFTRKCVAMSVTWYYWSFGFCSVANNYDSQMVLRCIVYRKSMALYSYFGSRVYIHLESLWTAKKKSISKFQNSQCKRVCNPCVSITLAVYLDFLPLLDFFLEFFFLMFFGGGGGCSSSSLSSSSPCPSSSSSSSSLSSLSLPLAEHSFQLANELGPLLVVALGATVLAAFSSSSLLPWELSLSPSDACISTCKA